ncbi:hypothetical protein ACKWTF_015879 [Chironomus riparius]
MEPNVCTNLLKDFLIVKISIVLFMFLASLPENSYQQDLINEFNIIEANCVFRYDLHNHYNCYLSNVRTTSPNDVLNIVGNHMVNHTDSDVNGVFHTSSIIIQFNGEVLRKFVNLRTIDLFGTFLQSINSSAFDVCGHLEELNIGSNSALTELPPRMLANCGNLRNFLAPFSRFATIPGNLFGETGSLETFTFFNGRLTSFPDDLLRNMQNLRRFSVRNCQISQLSSNNFINALNLEEIDLFGNRLNDTQAVMNLLNGHVGLRRIILSHNPFTMFSLSFFTQFRILEELGFGGSTWMTGVEWQFLHSSLRTLRVYAIFEEIPENAFVGVPNLTFLDITGYGITTIQSGTFSPLINLERLDMMYTQLTTFHPQTFASQGKLRALQLSYNQIEELPEEVFAPLVNLGFNETVHGLFMLGNNLRRLSANSFGQHPHLNYIYFNNNQIYAIQRGLFSRFNPRPALVDFSGNECTRYIFSNETNLDENRWLLNCFNNFEGITTTTPGGAACVFKQFEVLFLILVGFLKILMNLCH